ncbi:MAG: ribosome recycling factor [bacterium]|jgi:ribosome recycling factor|nr:ribosome recycling factor [bacterium]
MDTNSIIKEAVTKFNEIADKFSDEIKSIRTGRANSSMLDGITAEVYGAKMPLIQVATISVIDATLIQLTPFDHNNIEAISNSIRNNQSLSLNPTDDGRVIRIPIPSLTEERRKELVKQLSSKQEEFTVRGRSARHESINKISQLKKDKMIGEDDASRSEKLIDEEMNKFKTKLDIQVKEKEKEILTI